MLPLMFALLYLETALEEALGFCLGECNVKQLSVLLYIEAQCLSQPPPEKKKKQTEIQLSLIIHVLNLI